MMLEDIGKFDKIERRIKIVTSVEEANSLLTCLC